MSLRTLLSCCSASESTVSGDAWVDYAVIENHIDNELLEFEKIRSHEHNPTLYVELLGMALYRPLVHEYASKEERYRHILARLEKTPAFLDQAKQNLRSSPEVWTSVAREENRGNINLVEKVIPRTTSTASCSSLRKSEATSTTRLSMSNFSGWPFTGP